MSKLSEWFSNTFLGGSAEAESAKEENETKEKEQSEESKELEADKVEGTETAELSTRDKAEEDEDAKAEQSKTDQSAEPKPDDKPTDGEKTSEPDKPEAEPKSEPEEFNVEDHLDEFFWYLKEHPIYTKMLLGSSEALGARSVPVFYNRFTDPRHQHMLVKKDIKETVKKHFGGDLEKACAPHGGWYDREYRVADAKGNPTGEKTPSSEDAPGDGSSGDTSAA